MQTNFFDFLLKSSNIFIKFPLFYFNTEIVTQKDLQVKSSKIVAGLEPERTNELFQAIAFALENKLDSKSAVSVVNHGNGMTNGHDKSNDAKPKVAKEKPKIVKDQKTTRDKTPVKPEPKKILTAQRSIEKKPAAAKPTEKVVKERSTSKSRAADPKKLKRVPSKEKETSKVNGEVVTNGSIDSQNSMPSFTQQISEEKKEEVLLLPESQNESKPSQDLESNGSEKVKVNGDVNHPEPEPEKEIETPLPLKPQDELAAIIDEEAEYRKQQKTKKLSAKHRQKSVEDEKTQLENETKNQSEKVERFQSSYKRESFERPRTSLRPPSARPASSRPAAPRRRDKNIEIVLQPDEAMKLGDVNVKMENFTKELEDDGENLVIIEDSTVVSDNFLTERLSQNSSEDANEDEQGKLVQQILETEKNFEGVLGMEATGKRTEIVRFF